jgi:hypothetical protein
VSPLKLTLPELGGVRITSPIHRSTCVPRVDYLQVHHKQILRSADIGRSRIPPAWGHHYRVPTTQADGRKIEEIAFEELRAAALDSNGPDLPVEIARKFGVQWLAAASRARLEAAEKIVSAAATNTHTSSDA